MSEAELYREAYNAHESAEREMLGALEVFLRERVSTDGLACLCDPSWGWESRSSLSGWIVEAADGVLNARLNGALEVAA